MGGMGNVMSPINAIENKRKLPAGAYIKIRKRSVEDAGGILRLCEK